VTVCSILAHEAASDSRAAGWPERTPLESSVWFPGMQAFGKAARRES